MDYELNELDAVSTLQCGSILPKRHCGNTTRQIDWAIQQLYNGRVVHLKDHHLGGTHREANFNMLKVIEKRLPYYDRQPNRFVVNTINGLFKQILFIPEFLEELERRRY